MKKCLFMAALFAVFAGEAWGQAVNESRTQADHKRFGAYASFGNPFPSLFGIQGAYNFDDNLRAVVGYGEVTVTTAIGFGGGGLTTESVTARTLAAGADYLFTDWAFRPIVGARVGYFDVSGKGSFSISGFDKSTAFLTANAGFDWVANNGFHLGLGMNLGVAGGNSTGFYINSGYFF